MKRLFNHLLQILILGAIFLLMIKLPLFKIPHIQGILTGLIFFLIVVFMGIWMCKKKKVLKLITVGLLFFSQIAYAQPFVSGIANSIGRNIGQNIRCSFMNYCNAAEAYDKITFAAKQNNWSGDRPCEDVEQNCVRKKLNELKISPSVFKARDKLTLQQMQSYRSFRQDSHWNEWVNQYFSESAKAAGADPEELACAAKLASLCSEYERRHPRPTSLTVPAIMRSDAETVGCWPCKMSYIILTVVQDLSSDLESKMQDAALRILSIFFLLWILYTTFLAVIFPSKATNFLKDFMTRLLCVLVAAMILASGDNLKALYKNVLTPVIELGLGLTQQIGQAINVDTNFATEVDTRVGITSIGEDYCSVLSSATSGTGNPFQSLLVTLGYRQSDAFRDSQISEGSLLTPELQVALLCMTQTMYRQVSPMTAVGQSLIGFAQTESAIPLIPGTNRSMGFSFPDLIMWSVGFILVVLFTVFSFLVAFKIIDIFLRLGFVLVLMPLFVATWAFPATRDFTKKGFMFLMSIITEFLGLVLAINFIIVMFETGVANNRADLIAKMVAPYSSDYGENLLNVILSNGGWYFLFMIIALAFMGFKLLSVSTKIIASLFDGDIAKAASLGGNIVGAATVAGIQTAGQWGKKAWDVGSAAAENAESYHTPSDKSASFAAGRAIGRIKSGQNPLKDIDNPFRKEASDSVSAAPKRYFGEKAGEGVNKTSQRIARGLDRIGVTAGQALQKTGIGAIVGVPLTLATKTLSIGIRATGKITSGIMKAPGATAHGIKKFGSEIKRGFKRGDGK